MSTPYLGAHQYGVKRRNDSLVMQYMNRREEALLAEVSRIVALGTLTLTTPVLHTLLGAGIEGCSLSTQGWLCSRLSPPSARNALVRQQQHRAHDDPRRALYVAQACVRGKLQNMYTMLVRSRRLRRSAEMAKVPAKIKTMLLAVQEAKNIGALREIEADGAVAYCKAFDELLLNTAIGKQQKKRLAMTSINALLNLSEALLLQQVTAAIQLADLDPYIGFLHHVGCGHPALSLDIMEEFCPIVADAVVLNVVNRGVLTGQDVQEEQGIVQLKPAAYKMFFASFEERLNEQVRHPCFGYRTSYRRCIELQANLLGKWLMGEIPVYLPCCIE